MRARRERRVLYLLLACALVVYGALALALMGGEQTQTEYAGIQLQAAQLLDRCFQQVKGYKEELGIPLQELDYHQTGMLGEGYTGITTTLGALSQHIKVVPMADDEGGTCIVETPEEIVDASVSTQMSNIRDVLYDQMGGRWPQ